jgi:hypothetical protein
MPQIEKGNTTGSFLIDKRPYVVGAYVVNYDDPIKTSTTSNINIGQAGVAIAEGDLSEWTDNNGNTFADLGSFWAYIDSFFFYTNESTNAVYVSYLETLCTLMQSISNDITNVKKELKENNKYLRKIYNPE